MVTMAKKAKKDKSVIVTPDQADVANVSNDNASDEDTKPRKKKKKNKNKTKDTTSDNVVMDISCDKTESVETPSKKQNLIKEEKVIDQVKTTDRKSSGSIVRSSKDRMKSDYEFITSFLAAIHIPQHKTVRDDDDVLDDDTENGESLEEKQKRVKPGDTTRANNREELKQRLQAKLEELRGKKVEGGDGKKAEKKLKKKLAKIEKKKKEADELKQKLMTVGRNAGGKKGNMLKGAENMGAAVKKPGVKTDKGVVFSKFDFKDDLNSNKEVKQKIDPQAALNKLKKNKEKIKLWEEKGKSEKANKIENNIAWDNAINKAQGEKVKDDVTLLKKSIKKQKQIKSSSKKKWDKRADEVKNKESAFVEKREQNLNKRIKDKKDKKMKKLVAKGRHVPGF